jgi:hypothetical protein
MSHPTQEHFFYFVKQNFPQMFSKVRVLDIGSLDINGSLRELFVDSTYIGVDLGPGENVDVVSKGHEYRNDTPFDTVVSANCLEHDMFYRKTLQNMVSLTRSGGLMAFGCASTGFREHGTRKTTPKDAPLLPDDWADYYKNLTEADVREAVDFDAMFSVHRFQTGPDLCLYFWGIRR